MLTKEEIKEFEERLEEYTKSMQQAGKKIAQALRIRKNLAQKRGDAIIDYIRYVGPKREAALKILENCLKHDRKFIKIMDETLEASLGELKQLLTDWTTFNEEVERKYDEELGTQGFIKTFKLHPDEFQTMVMRLRKEKKYCAQALDLLIWILEVTIQKMEQIKSRIKHEEEFIAATDSQERYFKKFVDEWEAELELDKELIQKIDEGMLKKLKNSAFESFFGKETAIGSLAGVLLATLATEDKVMAVITLILSYCAGFCIGIVNEVRRTSRIQEKILGEIRRLMPD